MSSASKYHVFQHSHHKYITYDTSSSLLIVLYDQYILQRVTFFYLFITLSIHVFNHLGNWSQLF